MFSLQTIPVKLLDNDDPIREAGSLVEEGQIVAVKGNGGFHLATATTKSGPDPNLEEYKTQIPKTLLNNGPRLNRNQILRKCK